MEGPRHHAPSQQILDGGGNSTITPTRAYFPSERRRGGQPAQAPPPPDAHAPAPSPRSQNLENSLSMSGPCYMSQHLQMLGTYDTARPAPVGFATTINTKPPVLQANTFRPQPLYPIGPTSPKGSSARGLPLPCGTPIPTSATRQNPASPAPFNAFTPLRPMGMGGASSPGLPPPPSPRSQAALAPLARVPAATPARENSLTVGHDVQASVLLHREGGASMQSPQPRQMIDVPADGPVPASVYPHDGVDLVGRTPDASRRSARALPAIPNDTAAAGSSYPASAPPPEAELRSPHNAQGRDLLSPPSGVPATTNMSRLRPLEEMIITSNDGSYISPHEQVMANHHQDYDASLQSLRDSTTAQMQMLGTMDSAAPIRAYFPSEVRPSHRSTAAAHYPPEASSMISSSRTGQSPMREMDGTMESVRAAVPPPPPPAFDGLRCESPQMQVLGGTMTGTIHPTRAFFKSEIRPRGDTLPVVDEEPNTQPSSMISKHGQSGAPADGEVATSRFHAERGEPHAASRRRSVVSICSAEERATPPAHHTKQNAPLAQILDFDESMPLRIRRQSEMPPH